MLNIVVKKVRLGAGIADYAYSGPETYLKDEVGDIAKNEDDNESQRHLTQVTNAISHQRRVLACVEGG